MVATGPWSPEAAACLTAGVVDGLTLNYARGFAESDLDFLDAWPVKRLDVLDRTLTDLTPIARLGASLESLSIQAASRAEIDLRPLAVQSSLTKLILKVAPLLETLDGAEDLSALAVLNVAAARELHDATALASIAKSLVEVEFESCLAITALDDLSSLQSLMFLGISDCGRVESLHPVAELTNLEQLHAWGSTRIMDNDLSPLLNLPRLSEVRMRDRRDYRPRVSTIQKQLARCR